MVDAMAGVDHATGAARRRRQRRLRAHWRHEQLSLQMLLATYDHHAAPRGQSKARSRGEESEMNHAFGQKTPPPRALPLDFHGRVRVVRSMYLPAALHGIEASLLASNSLRRLRSAICRVVWSHRQPLANVGAALSLLDGPTGCDPAFCVVWFRFRLLRRYLALWPAEVGRVYRLRDMVPSNAGPEVRTSD